jgi:peptidoglycan/xylan/chitin deacetylase (PgdA/CDA1 family)
VRRALGALARLGAAWPLPAGPGATVLGYHRVRDDHALAISRRAFADQVRWLADEPGLPVVPLGKAVVSGGPAHRSVVITFDDAYDDTRAYAAELLVAAGLPATVYVPTALLGTADHMSAQGVRELAASGVDIGSHSRSHRSLLECDAQELEAEVRGSKEDLEDLVGTPVRSFAYPYGLHRRHVRRAVAVAGYEHAVVCEHGLLRRGTDPFRIPRTLLDEMTIATFAAVARGGLQVLAPLSRVYAKRRPR